MLILIQCIGSEHLSLTQFCMTTGLNCEHEGVFTCVSGKGKPQTHRERIEWLLEDAGGAKERNKN